MDRIKQMLDTISELTDEQLVELQSQIVSEFETVEGEDPTPQSVESMTALADMLDTVRGEAKRREAQAQELTTRAAEAAMRVKGEAMGDMEEPMEEMPEAEAPAAEEEKDADKEDKEEEKVPMEEASTATNAAAELSTTTEDVIPTSTAEVAESTPTITEEPVVIAAAEAAVATESEVVVEVVAAAEASNTESTPTTTIAQTEQEGTEATMTAAADMPEATDVVVEAPADRQPISQVKETAPVAITAGADIPGYTAGSTITDMREVADAFQKRLHGLRRVNGGDGEQHIVASLTTSYPESRQLTSDPESNWAKVQAVAGPEAMIASGGHSTPFEVKYDIFGFGITDRPIRDAFPRFSADRGGIRFIVPPVLSDYANAVGVWTAANDAAGSPDPATKTSLTVTAATETTVATDAVTLQLQFGNLMTRAYPELIARHNELALIQHAREADQYLASKLTAGSTAVTSTSLIGFGRDYLVQVGRAASAYRSRNRLDSTAPLRVIAPSWIKDAMVADLTLAMPGDATLSAGSEIDGYLAARGVNMTFSPDLTVFGSQGAAAMLEFPDSFTWYMFAEGTFLFLDGGTLDLGIIRDSTLVGTNDYKMFVETFEGIAKVGIESLVVTSTINVNGVAAALRDTTGGATAAAVEY